MPTAHERIGIALDLLTQGLYPYFEREMQLVYHDAWQDVARTSLRSERNPHAVNSQPIRWDAHAVLSVMWDQWNAVFRKRLGITERSLVGELREFRNRWAHQSVLTEDDCYRVLDSVQRLLLAIGVESETQDAENLKWDVLREKLGKKLNEDIAQSQSSRNRMLDVALFICCAISISVAAITIFSQNHLTGALIFSGFVLFTFAYFIYQRLTNVVPVIGVHECHRCRKIIYTEVCPYCDPVARPNSAIFRTGSSLKYPKLPEHAVAATQD